MSESNNFFIHKFNIERFAAQLQSSAASANSEYTRLMPLTDANPLWDLHVYDWRAMLNGVAIIAPETTITPGDPLATTADTVPRPPRDHLLLVDCPDPVAGSGRQLTQNGSLSLGDDSSVNCGILQNYIWNEPADGKTALLKLIVNREPRVGVEILLANISGTTNYVRCRNYLCGTIQSNCTLAVAGDGLPGASYDSTVYIQAECGPIEAEIRTITFTVIQRGAPGNPPGDVPDGACFSDYLYWETDPTNGIPRWMPGSTTADQLNGTPPDAGPTCVHIGCEAGGVSVPQGQGPSTVTSRQNACSVAVGSYAGHSAQGSVGALAETGGTTAVGFSAGRITQRFGATAIGSFAGSNNQGELSVALGQQAGLQNNDASNDRPTRNGTGDSGCIQLNLGNPGSGYSNGIATITTPGTPISVELVVSAGPPPGVIQSLTVLCGSGSGIPAPLPWTGIINPNGAGPAGAGGTVIVTALGLAGSSALEQLERTIVVNGSVEGGLNTDALLVQGHPLFPRAAGVPGGGDVWADACYVKPIREQTYSNQLAPPGGDYRWGLYYNQNTGEIVCSDVNTPGIPNGNCMSEYLYWNNVQGDWLIGGGNDISNMSDFSVHFGCQAMGGLEAADGYGTLGINAVAVGVNSAQFSTGDGRGRATAVGPFSGYTGQGRDAVAIGAAAGLGIVPQNGTLPSGTGAAITALATHGQFQNSVVLSGRGYQTGNPDLPLNTLNPLLAATSPVGTGDAAGVFTFTPPNTMADGDVVVGMLVQSLTGFGGVFAAGTYVCGRVPAAGGGAVTSITICGPNGAPVDLTAVTQVVLGNPQPVVDPSPALPNVGGAPTTTGGFFVAPLRQSPRNFLLVYDTSNKEILYEAYPQHNRLNAGDCYSDYLYWSPLAQKWLVGSFKVHIGCGAGGDDVAGQESQQGPGCVAVGRGAGHCGQGGGGVGNGRSVAIGVMSGVTDQGVGAVSVGSGISTAEAIPAAGAAAVAFLGQVSQGQYSVSVGCEAGRFSQGQTPGNAGNAVAVGHRAGHTVQGAQAIAIGADAGFTAQGVEGRAIGRCAAYSGQGANATAVGTLAGNYNTDCPPTSVVGDAGVNNIQVGYEANQQPASSIILNAALGDANANVDLNFNYVMFTAAGAQGPGGVFTRSPGGAGHLPVNSDAGAAVVSIYNIATGQDLVQAGDRVSAVTPGVNITIVHQDGSVEDYPVSAGGYRIIIRNTVASALMSGNALPLQALSQIGEVGFDAVVPNTVRSPVSGFFVSPIRQINKNYQLSYDPSTKEISYQYQQVPPDIGIGDCYSEYLYWDDGEGADPLTEGWRVGGGPAGFLTHDYGRVHFGCGAARYRSATSVDSTTGALTGAVVGTRANNLTIAVGYEAGTVSLGYGQNPSFTPPAPPASNPYAFPGTANVAIGYRAGYVNNFPRGVSIGFEAGYSGQGTEGLITPALYSNSTNLDSTVAIGNVAGRHQQSLGSVAVGGACGRTAQGGHSVAIGSQAAQTSQGFHALALGHMAGCSMSSRPAGAGAGIFPPGEIENQSSNSIIINCGDPMNQTVLKSDWGPLQSIAGTNLACGASLNNAGGTGYAEGNALTDTIAGTGSGMVIRILAVDAGAGNAITDFAVVQCGSGYNVGVTSVLNVIQQGHTVPPSTFATLVITNTENFPGPAVGASAGEILCINNQKKNGNAMPLPGQLVTGFFASPVRNCSGGFVMSYNPCTKEIRYNASKTADGIVDVDVGDCYSEYLYWDDGLGTTYAGNPGWKIGGTGLAGSDNGRVHIGCNAGEQEGASAAPAVGARAANLTIAIGLEAGQFGLGRFDNGHGANDNRGNIAIGYQSGWDRMYPRSVAIGYNAGRVFQGALGTPDQDPVAGDIQDSNVAIGNYAALSTQYIGSIAVGANAGRDAQRQFALAIGLQAGRTQQGFHSIALGHKAGFNMPARAGIFPAGTFDAQSANSIIVNAGDPKNAGVLESDWGPLQAISGSSSACGATINAAGSGYAIGVATTTTAGAGHGFVINIMAVGAAPLNDIITFGIVSCGSGYGAGDTVTVTGGNNDAVLLLNDGEIFPAPAAGASAAEIACIRNQGNQVDMPTSAGQPVTGFFVNPVRNVGGGFVMAYDPCTKEIKYNASKAIGNLPDLDDGDCYSEYLYWDDGLGTAYAGDPGWKVGGGPVDTLINPDRGRVHIGCGAGQYQAAGNPGTRAGQRTVAVGFNAGNIAMSDNATAIGESAGALNQGAFAVAVGSLAGSTNQSERGVAVGHRAGQSVQGVDSVAVGFEAGQSDQGTLSVALGAQAGTSGQAAESVAIGSQAGQISQQQHGIAIGRLAGRTTQGELGIAIGYGAGGSVQGTGSIAVGDRAGQVDQGTNCIAIGSRSGGNVNGAGQFSQQTLSVAIGHFCGHTQQGIAAAGGAGSCVAIGSSCSSTQQGANSIAVGYEAGQSHPARTGSDGVAVFPAGEQFQIVNSIVLNSGDPKNAGVNATNDHGPLQAIAGSSNFCNVASIQTPGADYVVGGATTSTAAPGSGPGSGMVVNITSVNAGGGVTGVTITDCGTGYTAASVIVLIQPGSNNAATISVNANEAFPPPNAGASAAAAACVNNQGNNDNMPLPGAQATGFFVNPVRNCSGGFVMSYNPCTKEIKYNASKLTDHLADFDLQGADCYSEYLYWDDGLGTAHAGDPGWKVGGGPQDGAANPDRGRVHLGCGAGQFQTIAGTAGTRAGQQSVAVGFKAGNVGMSDYNIAVGGSAAEYRQGWDNVASSAVADARSIAIGNEAAQTQQGANSIAVGYQAGQSVQESFNIAIGNLAGRSAQGLRVGAGPSGQCVAIGQNAAMVDQSSGSIAIGANAGHTNQGRGGTVAGTSPGRAIAIGHQAGQSHQSAEAIAIGYGAQEVVTGVPVATSLGGNIAIGRHAGRTDQLAFATALGFDAGSRDQGEEAVALGYKAGERTQHTGSLAIGAECGNSVQGQVIALSEPTNPAVTVAQAGLAIAIGTRAGYSGQRYQGIAVGRSAGRNDQGYYSLAIGSEAGQTNQGQQAIAIGRQAGCSMAARAPFTIANTLEAQPSSSIIINSGDPKNQTWAQTDWGPLQAVAGVEKAGGTEVFPVPTVLGASVGERACINNQNDGAMPTQGLGVTGFFVNPVRNCGGGFVLAYNPCTKEIKYNALKPIEDIPADLDQGDCYAEYLYWDDGAQSASGGPEMGWRQGGGNAGGNGHDHKRVHIGCGAGQYQADGTVGANTSDASTGRQAQEAVAIGWEAGHIGQEKGAIAVGFEAGEGLQGEKGVAMGYQAGFTSQAIDSVAIGTLAGYLNQGNPADQGGAVAIGPAAGSEGQLSLAVAIGSGTARYDQGKWAVALGYQAAFGENGVPAGGQGEYAIAVGYEAAKFRQGDWAIALGYQAGLGVTGVSGQGTSAIAIGLECGKLQQGDGAIAMGRLAGRTAQGGAAVAIGGANVGVNAAGSNNQGLCAVAVGAGAGDDTQGEYCVAIGWAAGQATQGEFSVAVGRGAGRNTQGFGAVAIGSETGGGVGPGHSNQGNYAIAIGASAGATSQETNAIAIGSGAGESLQSRGAVAIGLQAARSGQALYAVAVGQEAGLNDQQVYSVALGYQAGQFDQGLPAGGATGQAVAIGFRAGNADQQARAIAIGFNAGLQEQEQLSIAIGGDAGQVRQGLNSGGLEGAAVSIGSSAGKYQQEFAAIAIGAFAAQTNQAASGISMGAFTNFGAAPGQAAITMGYLAGSAGATGEYSTVIGVNITNIPDDVLVLGSKPSAAAFNMFGLAANATYINNDVRPLTGASAGRSLEYNTTTGEMSYNASKSFVLDHPKHADRYLVHACLEGPENGLYYRGQAVAHDEEKCVVEIKLPEYAALVGCDWTIQITARGSFNRFFTDDVDAGGAFRVHAEKPGEFFWLVHGKQREKPLETEPLRSSVELCGDGPYTYLTMKQ